MFKKVYEKIEVVQSIGKCKVSNLKYSVTDKNLFVSAESEWTLELTGGSLWQAVHLGPQVHLHQISTILWWLGNFHFTSIT